MTEAYVRPIPLLDPPPDALRLAGGWAAFTEVEILHRSAAPQRQPARALDAATLERLCAPRAPIAGLSFAAPRIMGILNVTPDSFSDGGLFTATDAALAQAQAMEAAGADLIDVGGESTRPGAADVPAAEEIARTAPVISAYLAAGGACPVSIDTRKATVAEAAVNAGAVLVNDVSALSYDPALADLVQERALPVCLMHAQGTPATMQRDPRYEDVCLDVYDALAARVQQCAALGIPRARILIDPGIGFGKTTAHNLALLKNLSLFHGLGCAILLGASRKRFIGEIGGAAEARDRAPGSLAVALHALTQGVQMLRVHDVEETRQALALWQAITGEGDRA